MKTRKFLAGIALTAIIPGALSASTVYEVSSTSLINCSDAPNGLWTNDTFDGSCANYFDIAAVFTDEEGVGETLAGSAINSDADEFGAAAWITADIEKGDTPTAGNHGDLNLQLTRQIPEPGKLALLGAGILAFGAHRAGKRK